MALYKIGSQLRILKTAAIAEDLMIERPLNEVSVEPKVVEKKNPEFLYFSARAISAGEYGPKDKEGKHTFAPNGNGDFFPWKELEASYESFVGRGLFLNHDSDHPIKSVGKIIDASLDEDSETGEKFVWCMAKIDRKLHPEIARKVETGELNTVSMGCSCEESVCSICGTVLHSDADQKCEHLSSNGLLKKYTTEVEFPEYGITKGQEVQAFAINKGITFNELSIVNIPADSKAVIRTVISNLKDRLIKKASLSKEEQLDLISQMENLFTKLDEKTKEQVKAEFCACAPVKEENVMSERDEYQQILSKISAYEFEKLEGYIQHKQKKDCAEKVAAKAEEKQESFLQKVIEKAKETVAGKIFSNTIKRLAEEEVKPKREVVGTEYQPKTGEPCTCRPGIERDNCPSCEGTGQKIDFKKIRDCPLCDEGPKGTTIKEKEEAARRKYRASFTKDESDMLKSSWSLHDEDKLILDASLEEIWGKELWDEKSQEDKNWAMSEEYGTAIVARYEDKEVGGLEKLAELWDVSYKLTDVKNSKVETPAKSEFVKPEAKTKADKEHEKSSDAVETKYEAKEEEEEVEKEAAKADVSPCLNCPHLGDSHGNAGVCTEKGCECAGFAVAEGRASVEASKESSQKKEADPIVQDPIKEITPETDIPVDTPPVEEEVKPVEEKVNQEVLEVKPEETPVSAFDKIDSKIDVGEGYEAIKDKETKEIVISKDGEEIKRLPDGFGDDIPTVLKLLRAVLGLPELGAEPTPPVAEVSEVKEEAVEEFKVEEPKVEELKVKEVTEEEPVKESSKESDLKIKEEVLNKKAEEIKKKEAELAAQKFSMLVNSRSERCRKVVESMVAKELISYDEAVLEKELDEGKAVLDARKAALEVSINKKVKELMAMNDKALTSFEKTVEETKRVQVHKKASKIPNLSYRVEIGADEEISAIFKSMGTLKNQE